MASELIGGQCVTTEDVFEEAKVKFYTKQGEMFSAQAISDLASHFLCCGVECIKLRNSPTTQMLDGHEIIGHLLKGNLVLVPYDADRNHGPCQKKGHKAHWALLTGFFAAIQITEAPEYLTIECEKDSEIPTLYYWSNLPTKPCSEKIISFIESNKDFYVFGHHGKSKYAGVWSLDDLLLSNDNLMEAGPERNSEEYVMPPGGVEAGLRSQIVVLKQASSV
ncbi:unnamed protein product [Lymnaea stagnalis]|uniref:Actin maturation protease n=1 Tax=Lymnaea stagnalis TaxID=6523 RepID=A0AAV2IMG2_LYMST